ncbi:MAG: outer membrane beta-barrel protein [Rhizobiaceae bacterium]|nr:outer membrane beta-barrel protein [Hyphomicrobiales bacterium]NRB29994.1 outer membrane beta-barrel protein [Rhizobiaceae bacterium]
MVSSSKFTWSVFAATLLLSGTAMVSPHAWAQQTSGDGQVSDDGSVGADSDLTTPADIQFSTSVNGEDDDNLDDFAPEDDVLTADRSQRNTLDSSDDDGNQRARATGQVGIIQPDGSVSPLANQRVGPVQGGGGNLDDSPYDALGIRLGTFTLFPVLTQSIGTTTNGSASNTGSNATFSQTEVRVSGQSDWALHELRGDIGGSYQTYLNGDVEDFSALDANLELRLDHSYDITTRFGASYDLTTESAESDNLSVPTPLFVTEDPDVHRLSGFAEIEKQAGRASGRLRGTITHATYEDASISDGSSLSQDDRANTLFELEARAGYEVSETFQPFVEASLGSRHHTKEIDRNGNRRDSIVYALRGGVAFDQGDKLSGEISLGYSSEKFDDSAIDDLNGFTVDASINWSPQRLTTITTTAQTEFTGSTNANEAGSVTYALTVGINHDLRPNLSLNASVLASLRDYDGSGRQDELLQAQIGAEWRLNRTAAIVATLGHEIQDSTDAASSYDATTARIGLRLQK